MIFDLGNLLVNLWKTWKEDREFQAWVKLVLSTIYSGFLGLTGAWGTALVSGSRSWVAFGYGLLGCGSSVLMVLLKSKQAHGLLISAPQTVVKQYQANSETVMEPGKK